MGIQRKVRSDLKDALALAEYIKFEHDGADNNGASHEYEFARLKNSFYKNGLEIQDRISPKLSSIIRITLSKLLIPQNHVHSFVYSSPEIQAECYSSENLGCIIRFSSALIKLLNEQELAFVIGHELGHYLYDHRGGLSINEANLTVASKAQEISADRLGLYACGSIDAAVSTMMKIASGLNSDHLLFDVDEFISQFSKVKKDQFDLHGESTHPSIGVRSRSLVWFAKTDCFKDLPRMNSQESKLTIDRQIIAEIHNDYDGYLGQILKRAREDYYFWSSALYIVKSGRFSRAHQQYIEDTFGLDMNAKLRNYLQSLSPEEALIEVQAKVLDAKSILVKNLKSTATNEIHDIDKKISKISEI